MSQMLFKLGNKVGSGVSLYYQSYDRFWYFKEKSLWLHLSSMSGLCACKITFILNMQQYVGKLNGLKKVC